MKPVYAVYVDDTLVAIFDEQSAAYQLRNDKRAKGKDATVDKHVLFDDIEDRNRLL